MLENKGRYCSGRAVVSSEGSACRRGMSPAWERGEPRRPHSERGETLRGSVLSGCTELAHACWVRPLLEDARCEDSIPGVNHLEEVRPKWGFFPAQRGRIETTTCGLILGESSDRAPGASGVWLKSHLFLGGAGVNRELKLWDNAFWY